MENSAIEIINETGINKFQNIADHYLNRPLAGPFEHDSSVIKYLSEEFDFEIKSRGFIAVPVHVHDLKLENYLNCIAPALKQVHFNICVFVNCTRDQCSEAEFEKALLFNTVIVQKWNSKSGFKGAAVVGSYLPAPASMGRVRRILTDAIISYCLFENIPDPVIVCNDVDQIQTSPAYLSAIISSFNNHYNPVFIAAPVAYGYAGGVTIGLPENMHIPELYLFNKIQDSVNYCTRAGLVGLEGTIWPEGANLAFSGTAYCSAGGFDPRYTCGEDDAIGRSLYALIKNEDLKPQIWGKPVYTDSAWVATDPRRVLSAIAAGRTGMEAWSWQDFATTHGSSLDTFSLAHKCADAGWVLKTKHFEHLSETLKNDNWEFVTSRIAWVFFRSVLFDSRTKNYAQLQNVASIFGLNIVDGILDRPHKQFYATIDWSGSNILYELVALFSKA